MLRNPWVSQFPSLVLFLTEEDTEKGDFVGAVVNASGLTGGKRAYADANSAHWAYEQFKTAREYGLVDGLQIKAYDKLNYRTAYFALYKTVKAKGITVNESESVLAGADVSGWNDEDKAMLAALVSVKIITADDIAATKSNDVVIRGEAAELIYKFTTAKSADDKPTESPSESKPSGGKRGCKGVAGFGISTPIIFFAAAVIWLIAYKKKFKV